MDATVMKRQNSVDFSLKNSNEKKHDTTSELFEQFTSKTDVQLRKLSFFLFIPVWPSKSTVHMTFSLSNPEKNITKPKR
jgi:hypothetical protein